MIGDVPLGQARPLFAVPRVDTLVRGQMPAVQRRMLFDMAVFDSCVLGGVPRPDSGLSIPWFAMMVIPLLEFSTYYMGPDATPHSRALVRDRSRSLTN